jgi:hypothetical protein
MSAKNVFMMGVLSMIASTGIFMASNGFAVDMHTTSNFEGVKTTTGVVAQAHEATGDTLTMSGALKTSEAPAPRGQVKVMDSKGNTYLLIPCKTNNGEACMVEYLVPYTNPTSR